MSESVNARNIGALAEAARSDRTKRDELAERLTNMERRVAMHDAELTALRQMVVTALVSRGNGPTAR